MQGIAVPPHVITVSQPGARMMLHHLFSFGVRPEALLLPKRPDQGQCRLCVLPSLQGLIEELIDRSKKRLSRYKEVAHTLASSKSAL